MNRPANPRVRAFHRAVACAGLALLATAAGAWAAEDHAPFPPGKDALLVKKVCASCHSAMLVTDRTYDAAAARKLYRLFVGDPDSDEGRRIVEYLSTVLADDPPARPGR